MWSPHNERFAQKYSDDRRRYLQHCATTEQYSRIVEKTMMEQTKDDKSLWSWQGDEMCQNGCLIYKGGRRPLPQLEFGKLLTGQSKSEQFRKTSLLSYILIKKWEHFCKGIVAICSENEWWEKWAASRDDWSESNRTGRTKSFIDCSRFDWPRFHSCMPAYYVNHP